MNVAVHCKKNVRNGLLAKVVNADTIDTLTVLLPWLQNSCGQHNAEIPFLLEASGLRVWVPLQKYWIPLGKFLKIIVYSWGAQVCGRRWGQNQFLTLDVLGRMSSARTREIRVKILWFRKLRMLHLVTLTSGFKTAFFILKHGWTNGLNNMKMKVTLFWPNRNLRMTENNFLSRVSCG